MVGTSAGGRTATVVLVVPSVPSSVPSVASVPSVDVAVATGCW